jgi:hypothetical protein
MISRAPANFKKDSTSIGTQNAAPQETAQTDNPAVDLENPVQIASLAKARRFRRRTMIPKIRVFELRGNPRRSRRGLKNLGNEAPTLWLAMPWRSTMISCSSNCTLPLFHEKTASKNPGHQQRLSHWDF